MTHNRTRSDVNPAQRLVDRFPSWVWNMAHSDCHRCRELVPFAIGMCEAARTRRCTSTDVEGPKGPDGHSHQVTVTQILKVGA